MLRMVRSTALWRGVGGIALFIALWEAASLLKLPFLRFVPAPHILFASVVETIQTQAYWSAVVISARRVVIGYVIGVALGVPIGLAFGVSRVFKGLFFPVFETLRPIPPLAWVPLSILLWPTMEQTVISVIFLGSYFTVVINVLGGVETVDLRYVRAAFSMGASRWQVFWRVVLPATSPSIFTGMAVAMEPKRMPTRLAARTGPSAERSTCQSRTRCGAASEIAAMSYPSNSAINADQKRSWT